MVYPPFARDVGELRRELARSLVAALLREQGVSADVGDQERPDLGAVRSIVLARVVRSVRGGHPAIIAPRRRDLLGGLIREYHALAA